MGLNNVIILAIEISLAFFFSLQLVLWLGRRSAEKQARAEGLIPAAEAQIQTAGILPVAPGRAGAFEPLPVETISAESFQRKGPKQIAWKSAPRAAWRGFQNLFAPVERVDLFAGARLSARTAAIETGLLALVVLSFCSLFLDLGSRTILPGNETEMFMSLDWIFSQSIRAFGEIPTWNPNYFTGLPMVGNPMFHSFNPLMTVPVLLFGLDDGFKIAVAMSLVAGALGMWWLAAVTGMGPLSRVWLALLFAFAGQPVARFFQGEYLFVLGWAWIPWALASLIALNRTGRRLFAATTAISLGLMFFSGNGYYPFYMVFVVLLFVAVAWLDVQKKPPFVQLDGRKLKVVAAAGALALGLVAVQLLPTAEMWPLVSKGEDLKGSHTPLQVVLDFVSKDTFRPDAYSALPAREEFYAYIGFWPFIPLVFLPLALKKKNLRILLFSFVLLIFSLIWIDIRDMPWADFYASTHILSQFRHPIRMIIFTEIALFILAGLSLDAVWDWAWNAIQRARTGKRDWVRQIGGTLAAGCLLALVIMSVRDVYSTNKIHTRPANRDEPTYTSMQWIHDQDSTAYFVRRNPNNSGYEAAVESNLRLVELLYHFNDIRNPYPPHGERLVRARPNLLVQPVDDVDHPAPAGLPPSGVVENYAVYHFPESLPFAFTVDNGSLAARPESHLPNTAGAGDELTAAEVTAQSVLTVGTGRMEVIAAGKTGATLVVLVTNYPGWQVRVDGRRQALTPVNNYLAVPALPGVHKYEFEFNSTPFRVGLVVSLLSLVLLAYLAASDTRPAWAPVLGRAREWARGKPLQRALRVLRTPAFSHLLAALRDPTGVGFDLAGYRIQIARKQARAWQMAAVLGGLLFGLSLGVYLLTRFWALDRFPIYFFCDEAVQTLLASDLIKNHFHNAAGQLLPTYFKNAEKYNLSLSVYLQVLPAMLFQRSVWVTRGVSALVSLLGAGAVCLTLKNIFKSRYWWSGALFLSITPAWFLHSRTAFETVLMVSFYAVFLYCYLMYRYRSPRYLYAALIFGGLSFYSYSPGQVIVVFSGLLLLISDWRYHWQQRATGIRAIWLLVLLALPYARFIYDNPGESSHNLEALGSYWLQPSPLAEKVSLYLKNYLSGFSPAYWYLPGGSEGYDIERHLMKGYGHILLATAPLAMIGLGLTLRQARSSAYRTLLVALLAVPSGAALVDISITRMLVMVIPAALLTALGAAFCLSWMEGKIFSYKLLAPALFLLLAVANVNMLSDAVHNGPAWFNDYTLAGMQYGGQQVTTAAQDYLDYHPEAKILISPSWANNTDAVLSFFLPDGTPIRVGTVDPYLFAYQNIDPDTLFVMTQEEYNRVVESKKFRPVQVEKMVFYPDGQTGFYFAPLEYTDGVKEIFTAEAAARRVLEEKDIIIDGQPARVKFTRLDMGEIGDVFDGDPESVIRTLEANPLALDLLFPAARTLSGVSVRIGVPATRITVEVREAGGAQPVVFQEEVVRTPYNRDVKVDFDAALAAQEVTIRVETLNEPEPAHVHVWEIHLE